MGPERGDKDREVIQDERDPPPYSAPGHGLTNRNSATSEYSLENSQALHDVSVTSDECIAHLKLIAAISRLRNSVMRTDKLFGLCDSEANRFTERRKQLQAAACIQEKRWSVYVARAVDRFTSWWQTSLPDLKKSETLLLSAPPAKITWNIHQMPPLDIIMVWHAFTLNPRPFLEDCLRQSKMSFWATGLPWNTIVESLDPITSSFDPGKEARLNFQTNTGRPWDNISEGSTKAIPCLGCKRDVFVPWTEASLGCDPDVSFAHCTGYADKSFRVSCQWCKSSFDHDTLCVQMFRSDVQALLRDELQMPGTLLSANGTPVDDGNGDEMSFPNRLIKDGIRSELLQLTDHALNERATIETLRGNFENFIKDRSLIRRVNGKVLTSRNSNIAEKVSIRNMLSRYWENSSIFSINLIGAVIRQGTFMEKLEKMDWIKSPTLESTISHFIEKYGYFFQIISKNRGHAVVPTLDIDLIWHTHQLSPFRYYNFSTTQTGGIYVNHDDKVDELKLSDAFAWTSLQYQKLTGGKLYSECTCWYCDAIREAHSRGLSRLVSSSSSNTRTNASLLHQRVADGTDCQNTAAQPHISSHNAVRFQAQTDPTAIGAHNSRLRTYWAKSHPKSESLNEVKDDPTLNGPYLRDSKIHPDLYPCNPVCGAATLGSAGNCISGTEGIGVDRGACVSGVVAAESRGRGKSFCAGIAGCGMGI